MLTSVLYECVRGLPRLETVLLADTTHEKTNEMKHAMLSYDDVYAVQVETVSFSHARPPPTIILNTHFIIIK